ncbi:aldehyde dehydrogenase [Caulobacter sp. Root655]|uniref:cysteine hydrolase family protein n=1 Tax=Caulobacter sp. Root655 TaxID=1736578 RepID=UPI0006F9C12D|nr:isochorismatase family cysteine hydrolase [Caulobacter sp. Root655]KRA65844.1 aldehyde dehydrogenase [Caulobacter sp. Root655]
MSSGLIVIDMINDFLDRAGQDRGAGIVARTNDLATAFRARGLPVIWVRQAFRADLSDAFLEMRDKQISISIEGTRGAEIDNRLDRRPEDLVLVKKRYSAFFGTDLDSVLAARGIGEVTLAGVNTHACVRTTAIDAYQRDLRVILATDCLASHDPAHAEISLRYMDGKIGRAMSNAEVIDRLGR